MKVIRIITFFVTFLSFVITVSAQQNATPPSGFLTDATFSGSFYKQVITQDEFTAFVSWGADMTIQFTIYRHGRYFTSFNSTFQTIGAENSGSKINISGNSYMFGLDGGYEFSPNTILVFGFEHLSSHKAQDLIRLALKQLRKGKSVPDIGTSDLNVFFVELHKSAPSLPLQPEFNLRLQPVGFRFRAGGYTYDQPVFLSTNFTLWQGHEKRLTAGSEHEFGKDSFNDFQLRLELLAKNQKEGRFQLFAAYSPGHGFHVSPKVGWLRNGWRTGLTLFFCSH